MRDVRASQKVRGSDSGGEALMDASADHLALLLKVNAALSSARGSEDVMQDLIAQVISTLGGQRGFVVLRKDDAWESLAAHYVDPEVMDRLYSRNVVNRVAESGEAMLTTDALADPRTSNFGSVAIQNLRSIMCAPLRWAGEVRGVVYVDHNVRKGVYNTEHLQVLRAIADQASRALETADLYEQLQRVHRQSLVKASAHGEADESQAGAAAVDFALSSLDGVETGVWQSADFAPGKGVALSLFGSFRVAIDGVAIEEWSTRKNRDLLAYLAAHRGQLAHEETLMDLFWSQGGKKGLHSLHNSITGLRKTLGGREMVQRKLDGYTLGPDCWIDVEAFSAAFHAGRHKARLGHWEQALPLLRQAEALAGDELLRDNYSDWALSLRQSFAEPVMECRQLLAEHFARRGKHVVAVELWKRVLQLDNCSEEAYRGLMEAYRALGREAEVMRTYQTCVKAFEEELELPPPPGLSELLSI